MQIKWALKSNHSQTLLFFYDDNKKEPEQVQNTHLIDEDIGTFTYKPDTLMKFIEDIINPDLLDNGKIPSYSKLHTKISLTHKNRDVVSKNTIKKYLSQ